ncbi:MAG: diadenylate cyclase CdaA [Oscillospiraceae bacterium]|uniref:Diadenylate cyclase n=1 Tax=Hominenteromicrobium mulieris TaxID=2885357 RepID=A0AAE3AGT0_9FIRM|nr:diadenylate cyclase CdaA [Hominenteromicrobium mulieris]MCC2136515.1 diadenylate cyclase CdaA [Hominenteromicrobium mulieris]
MNKVFEAIASWWEWMVSIAMNFQFKDAVDIIIVAFLIYGVVKLVRETRAGQLVKGLFLLVILFIISSYFNLVMVSRVLAYFFQFAFVAILIVFQPEIRKALEQVGRNNVGQSIAAVVTGRDRSYDRAQIRKAINAVVDGVGILQQLKMGALIVFERKTKLGDIIETGTQINCEPSGQIVGNIFFNKAPLHDGAMIIRDGMIHAAGCILPLTKNTSVSAELGTRHRAALGVSEESDAVVVVVSEETGQISVAVNGVLARRFTRDTLRDVLEGYLIPQEEASTVRRKFGVLKSKRTVKK